MEASTAGPQSSRHPRDYPIFRPRVDECPVELLGLATGVGVDLDAFRVSKHGDAVIAAYMFKRLSSLTFEIESIAVCKSYHHQGVGSWLLAHAIGIIESKGGREVVVHAKVCPFFSRIGFKPCGPDEMRLQLTSD